MNKRIVFSLLIIFSVVLFDQYTKYLAQIYILPHDTIKIFPVLNLVNVRNQGAAFGMFSSLGNTFFIVIAFAAIFFMAWIIVTAREDFRIFSLLLGGAAGNLIDRVRLGYVVDFIDFTVSGYHWPAFNIADSALSVGIAIMIFSLFTKKS